MDSCVSNLPGMEVETEKKRRQREEREALDNFGDGDDADSRRGKNVRSKVSHFTFHSEMLTAKNRISVRVVKGRQSRDWKVFDENTLLENKLVCE